MISAHSRLEDILGRDLAEDLFQFGVDFSFFCFAGSGRKFRGEFIQINDPTSVVTKSTARDTTCPGIFIQEINEIFLGTTLFIIDWFFLGALGEDCISAWYILGLDI
jgi:hypothetical protein